ncbi:membrane-bound lytic murein transglycosylase D [Campylobacter pinnipediorum subsp. pinnipediorum]|uniref:Lytic transglycosylase n=1 Tax=Campylobacter pinnipediorum subsp. pinnipediorum TaxID=1660067 RepID=A0AAX0LB20_9BACT|nr:lytic transglycosylase domain-containing protein [Campylobacter pinnipediorum]AQW81659.1 membrane-bound lytic murein transglycosylase D [Campylobacter pinnipediorum subsp. pinnipediorum]OPA81681.1 lytic transglycosylase [Campylobacter pinnipediorum subsp. pinnipediorum]
MRNIIIKILLVFACISAVNVNLFANISQENQLKILKQLDIPYNFANTNYFKNMNESITKNQVDDFSRKLKSGYKYIPTIKNTLQAASMPDIFFYLAMVESGFSNKVISNAKAAGIWQFMSTTAKVHGLKIDKYVDERRDPVKATKAASEYLKGLKNRFGKWYLAILAYNCGEGKLRKAIRQANTDDLETLLDPKKRYLPKETRNFIMKIIRASFIEQNQYFTSSPDFNLLNKKGAKLIRVAIPGGTSLKKIGESIGVGVKKIRDDNTHLNFAFTPPNAKNYYVYIPENKKDIFNQNFKPIKYNNRFYTYTVKKGDTLIGISKSSGVSHKAIKEYNDLTTSKIAINQKIIIPRSDKNKFQNYIVRKGDTLEILSKKFNVNIKDIKEANAFASSDILTTGASIVIP